MNFLAKIFCRKDKPKKPEIVVTEGIEGHWHYHLSHKGTVRSLCGKQIMPTHCSMNSWGLVGDLNENYCEKCKKIYDGM